MDAAEEARAAWQTIAPSYASARQRPWPLVEDFFAALEPGARLLDVGAGGGRHARAARARGLAVIEVDFVRGFAPNILGDAAALPLRDGCADAVLIIAVLSTMPLRRDRIAALREARRVLRPGGRVLLTAWAKWQEPYLKALLGRGSWQRTGAGRVLAPWTQGGSRILRPYFLYTPRDLRRELAAAGWGSTGVRKVLLGPGRLADNLVFHGTKPPG